MSDPMNEQELQRSLDGFAQDPAQAMAQRPEKRDASGRPLSQPATAFAASDLANNRFVLLRDTVRRNFSTLVDGVIVSLEDLIPGKAAITAGDRAEDLVDAVRYRDLAAMEAAGLMKGHVKVQPWSDDYWALYQGCLGKRYADAEFPADESWKVNRDYVLSLPAATIVASGDDEAIDALSPAEKFDLLVGLPGTLTEAMWALGQSFYESQGKVETWMGICHGWAPASYMLPRPTRPLTVLAANGKTKLTFYPSDLKGLASLLWAQASTVSKFIGNRCNEKEPAVDANGRVQSAAAFDTNPGTWHLAAVNQLGAAGRSFVLDATYDYEVWNQPACGYQYIYFNPQTMKLQSSLGAATVSRSDFSSDKFHRYRSPNAAFFVGIIMQVSYIREVAPAHSDSNGPANDCVHTVTYQYDLELDANKQIIGGEWYVGKFHPDFLWTPASDARAQSPAEELATEKWDSKQQLPTSWKQAAASAAARGLPLAKLIEALLKLASG